MKLKKIVSLALAGILAVSMLTACGDKGSSSSSSSSESTGSATGVSAKVDALLDQKDKIDMTDNAAYAGYLSSVLKKADLDAEALLKAPTTTTGKWDSDASDFNTVVTGMQNQFAYNVNNYAVTDHAITNYEKPEAAGDVVYMSVAVFSGELGENVVLQAIANKMNAELEKDAMPAIIEDSDDTLYNVAYTGSVSLQKVSDGSASAWFAVVTIAVDTTKRA